jgi:hypothetical protein
MHRPLRLPLLHQDPAHLLAPIAGGVQIPFPYAAIAAAPAATGRLLRRIAKNQFSLRQLCAEVGNPLPRLKSIVGQQGLGIVIHVGGGTGRARRTGSRSHRVGRSITMAGRGREQATVRRVRRREDAWGTLALAGSVAFSNNVLRVATLLRPLAALRLDQIPAQFAADLLQRRRRSVLRNFLLQPVPHCFLGGLLG